MGHTLSTPAFWAGFRRFWGISRGLNAGRGNWRGARQLRGGPMKKCLVLAFAILPVAAAYAAGATIVQKGRAFRPGEVTINRGEALTFTNEDSFVHQIYLDGQFDSEEKGAGE